MTTIGSILHRHQLQATGITLNGRAHNQKVLDAHGKALILKTARIDRYQVRLLLAAQLADHNRSFITQKLYHPQEDDNPEYLLLEYIEGSELKTLYDNNLTQALAISKAICLDYQLFIQECQAAGTLPRTVNVEEAYGWMGRMYYRWIRRIMDRKLLSEAEAHKIASTLFGLADQDPTTFFGYNHGNIHGEHIILPTEGKPCLLDLTIEPRPGTTFYDQLRVLDYALLEHPHPEKALPEIVAELKELKAQHDPVAVQAVWAFRCIGLLGADILGDDTRVKAHQYTVREQIALAMIRGEY